MEHNYEYPPGLPACEEMWRAAQLGDVERVLKHVKAHREWRHPGNDYTPLLAATHHGSYDVVNALINAKANIEVTTLVRVAPLCFPSS